MTYFEPRTSQTPQQTNTAALVSFICAFCVPPLGIVAGHAALKRIRDDGEPGRGIAKAGLIIGYVLTSLWIAVIIAWFSWTLVLLNHSAKETREDTPVPCETTDSAEEGAVSCIPPQPPQPAESDVTGPKPQVLPEPAQIPSGSLTLEEAIGRGYSSEFCKRADEVHDMLYSDGKFANHNFKGARLGELGEFLSPNHEFYRALGQNSALYEPQKVDPVFLADVTACEPILSGEG